MLRKLVAAFVLSLCACAQTQSRHAKDVIPEGSKIFFQLQGDPCSGAGLKTWLTRRLKRHGIQVADDAGSAQYTLAVLLKEGERATTTHDLKIEFKATTRQGQKHSWSISYRAFDEQTSDANRFANDILDDLSKFFPEAKEAKKVSLRPEGIPASFRRELVDELGRRKQILVDHDADVTLELFGSMQDVTFDEDFVQFTYTLSETSSGNTILKDHGESASDADDTYGLARNLWANAAHQIVAKLPIRLKPGEFP